MKSINFGLIGAGTVGGGVVKLFDRHAAFLAKSCELPVKLSRIADKATDRFASLPVNDAICTADADDVLSDPAIDVVIELVGGMTFAKAVVLKALNSKKHVITANKALLAEHGPEIFAAAEKNGVSVYFEAAVGGGMPVIKTIREALIGNDIVSVKTIINGTCNYILTKMTNEGLPFADVLAEAQKQGYAETDPTLDVGGGDTGHKVAIMASLLFGGYADYSAFSIEGITSIGAEDIQFARELGYTIKLLGIIKKEPGSDMVDIRVHPAMLHADHILSSVSGVFNAVVIEGDAVGPILLYGRGAGELPTASAVISDVVDVARNIVANAPRRIAMNYYNESRRLAIKPVADVFARYYLRFTVTDEPGVLASLTTVLGKQGISIASVMQKEGSSNDHVPVIIITHKAQEQKVRAALKEISGMKYIKNPTQLIRIEE